MKQRIEVFIPPNEPWDEDIEKKYMDDGWVPIHSTDHVGETAGKPLGSITLLMERGK